MVNLWKHYKHLKSQLSFLKTVGEFKYTNEMKWKPTFFEDDPGAVKTFSLSETSEHIYAFDRWWGSDDAYHVEKTGEVPITKIRRHYP